MERFVSHTHEREREKEAGTDEKGEGRREKERKEGTYIWKDKVRVEREEMGEGQNKCRRYERKAKD